MTSFNSISTIQSTFNFNIYVKRKTDQKLRVVTLNYLPSAYRFASDWIAENGHEHILAVTSPGIKTRPTPAYQDVLPLIDQNVPTLVTSKMKSVLTPMLRQLKPDIILCFTFSHRLDAELCQIPTFGVVNIHPSVLPSYRGPNPMRQFYDGAKVFGVTAHRMSDDYDTGEILSQEYEPMPAIVTPNTAFRWGQLIKKAIANGMEIAISGKRGIIQDDTQATYAAPFTDDEKWINFNESTATVLRKTLALNLSGGLAKAVINGKVHKIHSAQHLTSFSSKPPQKELGIYDVLTSDGMVRITTELFDDNKKYSNVLPCSAFFEQTISTMSFG
jgi:methionyl-tRNA formyltransferase